MKALTVRQPYAHFIATGEKLVENRRWCTNYRGDLAIQAAKTRSQVTASSFAGTFPPNRPPSMAFGAVVCVARLVACMNLPSFDRLKRWRLHGDPDFPPPALLELPDWEALSELDLHTEPPAFARGCASPYLWHAEGPFCWMLTDVRPLSTPVKSRGERGVYELQPEIAREVTAALAIGTLR